jgi:hypothetical protein
VKSRAERQRVTHIRRSKNHRCNLVLVLSGVISIVTPSKAHVLSCMGRSANR